MDLSHLYQDLIVDHNRSPKNFRRIETATHRVEGFNPLCGDKLTVYVRLESGRIRDVAFEGSGCAISIASASLMTEALMGKKERDARALFDGVHNLLTGKGNVARESLGKLAALEGVHAFPSRVKCASLCWHTLKAALDGDASTDAISTE